MTALAAKILAVLPQTQCTRCAYPDCAAYAQAIAHGKAGINQCPPGGAEGIERLAAITGQSAVALNPANGTEGPRSSAFIDEDWCIGCTLCIEACPTDAIVGSNKLMHTVIEAYCTGCELCLPVCPVDCIQLENLTGTASGWTAWSQSQADLARSRYEFNSYRRKRDSGKNNKQPEENSIPRVSGPICDSVPADTAILNTKRAVIESALARARAERHAGKSTDRAIADGLKT